MNWMEIHTQRAAAVKVAKDLEADLKVASDNVAELEKAAMAELILQAERGDAPTHKMGDGTIYTRYSLTPWSATGASGKAVKEWLVENDHLILIGAPKMGKIKTHFNRLGEEPPEELDVHITRKEVFKLSVTAAK